MPNVYSPYNICISFNPCKYVQMHFPSDKIVATTIQCTVAPRYYAPRFYAPHYYAPRYYVPRYYVDSDITQFVVDHDFLPSRENAKWACLNLLTNALTILKKH